VEEENQREVEVERWERKWGFEIVEECENIEGEWKEEEEERK
jgi:hypothetical protein